MFANVFKTVVETRKEFETGHPCKKEACRIEEIELSPTWPSHSYKVKKFITEKQNGCTTWPPRVFLGPGH